MEKRLLELVEKAEGLQRSDIEYRRGPMIEVLFSPNSKTYVTIIRCPGPYMKTERLAAMGDSLEEALVKVEKALEMQEEDQGDTKLERTFE